MQEIADAYRALPACPLGKVPFLDRQAAVLEAARISRKPRREGPDVPSTAFRCRHCGAWHIGRLRR